MCHGYEPTDWRTAVEEEDEDEETDPSFLNEERDTDVELVTYGGDED